MIHFGVYRYQHCKQCKKGTTKVSMSSYDREKGKNSGGAPVAVP